MLRLFPAAATRVTPAHLWRAWGIRARRDASNRFAKVMAERLGMAEGVALTSLMRNTALAMTAAARTSGGRLEVILPRYCCPSFIHGIKAAGVAHRYCDIDPDTLALSPDLVEQARTSGSNALLVPNLFGLSADMSALSDYCRVRGLLLIEGADYSLGGTFAGRPLGGFGDFALLNFQEGKALPVGGGMALSRQGGLEPPADASRASSAVAFARALAYSVLIRPFAYGLFSRAIAAAGLRKKSFSMEDTIRSTERETDFAIAPGDLWRQIAPFQSALGWELLPALESECAARWRNAMELETALSGISGVQIVRRQPSLQVCNYIRYPILVPAEKRDALCAGLIRGGYEASPMYVEHGMQIDAAVYPGAARVCAELLTLPCHSFLNRDDLNGIAKIIRTRLH